MTNVSIDVEQAALPGRGDVDLLRLYLDELGSYPLIDRSEEVRLAQAIEAGERAREELDRGRSLRPRRRAELRRVVAEGRAAREEFTRANLRLVVSIAKRYQHHGVDLVDLIQDGNMGLIRAIERFDWRRGYKFSTYATWWIRKAVVQSVTDGASSVRLPRQRRDQARALAEATERLEHRLGHPPGPAALAAETGMRQADVVAVRRAAARVVSLSTPVDEDGNELGDLVADPTADTGESAVATTLPREVEQLLEGLSSAAARVLRLRFGIGGDRPRTAAEVGAMLSISPERVRQIEARALAALRQKVSPLFWAS